MTTDGVVVGDDGVARCWWGDSAPEYRPYHDREWGFPVAEDSRLFEKLSLEGFQAGLSWLTILRKREAFRRVFAGFDFERIAGFDEHVVTRLLADASIIRHRGKIEAVINNARRAVELVEQDGSLAAYVWRFEPAAREGRIDRQTLAALAQTSESQALARDLKRRGWRFVGPTTVYAFMQAMGLVRGGRAGKGGVRAAGVRRPSYPLLLMVPLMAGGGVALDDRNLNEPLELALAGIRHRPTKPHQVGKRLSRDV